MRLLSLSVCALSLSACSMGGLGFGAGHAGYETSPSAGHGTWHMSQTVGYAQPYGYGAAQAPCAGPTHMPTPTPTSVYNCGTPPYVPPVAPCYTSGQNPCATAAEQPVQYAAHSAPVHAARGYTSAPMPAPVQYAQPQASSCDFNSCAGQYAVSPHGNAHRPYGYGYGQMNDTPQSPSVYVYGTDAGPYGTISGHGSYKAMSHTDGHFYGTLGTVWYDVDRPYAGVQARLGYQATPILGAEIEGSIGVINEASPFNQDLGGGTLLSGEFKDGVDYSAAAFATARIPLSYNISTHARLGYHTTRTFADVDFDNNPTQKTTTTMDGLAYGGGIQMDITPVDAIRADFTRYEGDTDNNDSVSLAYLRRF